MQHIHIQYKNTELMTECQQSFNKKPASGAGFYIHMT
jgi:hypothetical protein